LGLVSHPWPCVMAAQSSLASYPSVSQEREDAEKMFGGSGVGETAEQAAAKTFEPGEGLPEAAGLSIQGQSPEAYQTFHPGP
jgi:hypothetical protein